MKCDLLHALVTSSPGVTLLSGHCNPARSSLLPAASRSRNQGNHRVGSPPLLTDDILESCDSAALQGSPLPGRVRRALFLSKDVRMKALTHTYCITELKGSLAILMTSLSSYPSWDDIKFESLPDRKVHGCKIYFQWGTFSINSDIKDKEYEAGAEMGFKVMNDRNVLTVCLCQLGWLLVDLRNPISIQVFPTEAP